MRAARPLPRQQLVQRVSCVAAAAAQADRARRPRLPRVVRPRLEQTPYRYALQFWLLVVPPSCWQFQARRKRTKKKEAAAHMQKGGRGRIHLQARGGNEGSEKRQRRSGVLRGTHTHTHTQQGNTWRTHVNSRPINNSVGGALPSARAKRKRGEGSETRRGPCARTCVHRAAPSQQRPGGCGHARANNARGPPKAQKRVLERKGVRSSRRGAKLWWGSRVRRPLPVCVCERARCLSRGER